MLDKAIVEDSMSSEDNGTGEVIIIFVDGNGADVIFALNSGA